MAAIAHTVGYGSESALSVAFKRRLSGGRASQPLPGDDRQQS